MPFGGRRRELLDLNSWLTDPTAPRAMLITAPAGRGKTALLVRWIHQTDPNVDVCFVPISIRYDTNRSGVFYQAMAHRLAEILGVDLPQPATNPADYYKDKVLEFIDGFKNRPRPCLLIIDGLDEASGWQVDSSVLPAAPPSGLRIVVSARQLAGHNGSADWKAQLGWDQPYGQALDFEVPLLDLEGIADVLSSMGDPLAGLYNTADLVAQLHRLTEGGDPLLLKLYVEDLAKPPAGAARLQPENLPALPSGFGAYFRRWFAEQRQSWLDAGQTIDEPRFDAVFAILACALGPLSLKDIGRLVDIVAPNGPIVTLNTIVPLRRFIIGDGLETNLALSHPKLADYIKALHFGNSQIIDNVRAAYLRLGELTAQELNSGSLAPNAASRYLLTYYIQHLEAARPVPLDRFRELTNAGWRAAWRHLEGGDRSFSEQLEICFATLLEACNHDRTLLCRSGTGVGGLVHIGLCLSSIRSSGTSCPVNFLFEMTREGLISLRHALFISSFQSEHDRAELISRLGPTLDRSLIAEVEREARRLPDLWSRSRCLVAISHRMPPDDQKRVLREVILVASRARSENRLGAELAMGEAVALAINNGQPFATELRELAAQFVGSDRLPTLQLSPTPKSAAIIKPAESAPEKTIYVSRYGNPLVDIAESCAALAPFSSWAGTAVGEQDYLNVLLQAFPSLDRAQRRTLIQYALQETGTDILLGVLSARVDEADATFALQHLLGINPDLSDDFGTAEPDLPTLVELGAISAAQHPALPKLLYFLGPLLSEPQFLQLLREMLQQESYRAMRSVQGAASSIPPALRRAAITSIAGSSYLWSDDMVAALTLAENGALLNEVLERLSISDFFAESFRDCSLLDKLLPACDHTQIDTLVHRLMQRDLEYKVLRMLAICGQFASAKVKEELLELALRSEASDDQRRILDDLAPYLPPSLLQQALNDAANLADVSERVSAVDALLPALAEDDRGRAVRQVYRLALEIHDEPFQLVALAALGQRPSAAEQAEGTLGWAAMLEQTSVAMHRAIGSCLVALLPNVNAEQAKAVLLDGLHQADRLPRNDRMASWLLAALAPYLNPLEGPMVIRTAVDLVKNCPEKEVDATGRAILLMSPHLDQIERDHLVTELKEQLAKLRTESSTNYWAISAIAAANPRIPAIWARSIIEKWFAEPVAAKDREIRQTWLPLLMLSAHLTPQEQALAERALLDEPAEIDDSSIPQCALLPYTEGEVFARLGFRLLEYLRRSPRQDALSLLALVEGNWGETLNLRPAIANGRPARSFLERFGGPDATREAIDAITFATRLWP